MAKASKSVGVGNLTAHGMMKKAEKLDAMQTVGLYVDHAVHNGIRITVDTTVKNNKGPRFMRQIRRHILEHGVDA